MTFDRIGQHGGRSNFAPPPPAPIVRSFGGEKLADSIAMYARRFLGSASFEVVIDEGTGKGWIFAGMRTAGTFTVTTTEGGAR